MADGDPDADHRAGSGYRRGPRALKRLGIDEHRFRTVRYLRDSDTNAVKRVEPWSIVFTDLDDGAILDVVDGRRGATVKAWLAARPRWRRHRVQIVTLDMGAVSSARRP